MIAVVVGWDIGGANVKAARLASAGDDVISGLARTTCGASSGAAGPITGVRGTARPRPGLSSTVPGPRVAVRPFALWREPDRLAAVLTEVGAELGAADVMAITMTAELADCFASKREGVCFVLDAFRRAFPDAAAWVYGLDGSFHGLAAAQREPLRFAAANWLATATWIAQRAPDALLIDVGSTTTDVVPIVGGRVRARGRTDTERLALGELVYTGILRTPVCALIRRVPLRGAWCRVAAEHFAIAADAYLWLRRIESAEYSCETPDGRGTTRHDAGRRLARMVCGDHESLSPEDITGIARRIIAAQTRVIASAVTDVLAGLRAGAPSSAVIAGAGYRLAATVARRAGLDVLRLEHLAGSIQTPAVSAAAPAAAVANLLVRFLA
ncbi:MAG: hydantoinase/oxoprolinase family protein [Longimicrobiales bacterium]